MLVYRCWVVYNRSWLVISLPLLLILENTAVTGVTLYLEITLHTRALLNIRQLKPFGAAFWAITIVLNVLTTATRTSVTRQTSVRPVNTLQYNMRIVVESGLLYTGTSLITFITYITNSVAVYEVQVIGIAFNLIIIRAAQGTRQDPRARNQYSLRFMGPGTQTTAAANPIQHINVMVTREDDLELDTVNKPATF
ncbi:hypothetical protein C8R43DRAFT_952497 [Mycena crocata]|nr:hypothetical protein C8R43DRAFT_952497 [Mycena crocata]